MRREAPLESQEIRKKNIVRRTSKQSAAEYATHHGKVSMTSAHLTPLGRLESNVEALKRWRWPVNERHGAGIGGASGKIPTVWYAYVHVHIQRRGASRGLDGRDEVGLSGVVDVGNSKVCGGRANGRAAAWRSGGGALCSIRQVDTTLFPPTPSSLRL